MGYLQTIRYRTIASTSSFHVASSGCTRKVSENSILWRKICPRRRASAPASRNLPSHTPNPRKIGRAFHPAAGARNEPRVTAAARTATRHACGSSISHTLRRQPKQPRATAAARTATCYGGNSIIHALRRWQPTQKRGRCQSNGPAKTMRYISLRKRFLISSTLASRGLPGAQASA